MRTYSCTCGNRLFFENTRCVVCQSEVGWCENCRRITALEPASVAEPGAVGADAPAQPAAAGLDYRCSHADCRAQLRKCHNYAVENVCNHLFVIPREGANENGAYDGGAIADSANGATANDIANSNNLATTATTAMSAARPIATAPASALAPAAAPAATPVQPQAVATDDAAPITPAPIAPAPVEAVDAAVLCAACQLTETIPDLSIPGHREKWARLEVAKRRLLFTLDKLGLPYADANPRLSFDFKADIEPPGDHWRDAGPTEIVYTGHCDGKVTINIREADDAEREKLRLTFHEAHRTLIGHFRHEVGHYYWQLLVQDNPRREREFIAAFGDHNDPSYADAMAAYYQNGPAEDWPKSFISAYASAHPWEDFAETFALYLDIVSVVDTAHHLFKASKVNLKSRTVDPLVERFQEVGILVNEFNRVMGLLDLVPEVVVDPVVEKLQSIHKLVKGASKGLPLPPGTREPAAAPRNEPVPVLMQQGSRPAAPVAVDAPMFEPAIFVGGAA